MLTNPTQAESLRKAIEGLIDAKLHDALARPGGLDRLIAHRRTGVASYDIRQAERRLEQTLADTLVWARFEGQLSMRGELENPASAFRLILTQVRAEP